MRLRETAPWIATAAVALAGVLVWRGLWGVMFTRNPQYELRRLEITTGSAKSEEEIRSITGLREGVNLFSFSASEVRERLLRTTPNIAEAEVSKILPSNVVVVVRDRVPVARLYYPSQALDRDGMAFTLLPKDAGRYRGLPTIENGRTRHRFDAGRTLVGAVGTPLGEESRIVRALDVVNAWNAEFGGEPRPPFRLMTLDVSDSVYLETLTTDSRVVRFVWEEIVDEPAIRVCLRMVARTMADPGSRGGGQFDALLSAGKVIVR